MPKKREPMSINQREKISKKLKEKWKQKKQENDNR